MVVDFSKKGLTTHFVVKPSAAVQKPEKNENKPRENKEEVKRRAENR